MEYSEKVIFKLDELLKARSYPKLRLAKNAGLDYRTVYDIVKTMCKK